METKMNCTHTRAVHPLQKKVIREGREETCYCSKGNTLYKLINFVLVILDEKERDTVARETLNPKGVGFNVMREIKTVAFFSLLFPSFSH